MVGGTHYERGPQRWTDALGTSLGWVFLRKALGTAGRHRTQSEGSAFKLNNILHIPFHPEYQKLESASWKYLEKAYFIYYFQ